MRFWNAPQVMTSRAFWGRLWQGRFRFTHRMHNGVIWHNISWSSLHDRCNGSHDDVIKWKHFPRYWPFVRGIHRSPVNSPHKGQWRGALMFSLICVCAWINGWVNNCEAGDLRRHGAHYDVTVMDGIKPLPTPLMSCLHTLGSRINTHPMYMLTHLSLYKMAAILTDDIFKWISGIKMVEF